MGLKDDIETEKRNNEKSDEILERIKSVKKKVHKKRPVAASPFVLSDYKRTFSQARSICQSMGKELAMPVTRAVNQRIRDAMAPTPAWQWTFIGITDEAEEG